MKKDSENYNTEISQFLARMSHEIKTPVNGIIGMTNIARKSTDVSEEMQEYLDKIDRSAYFLKSLINDIFDMSKIKGGKVTVEKRPFSLFRLIESVEAVILPQTEEKEITLLTEYKIDNGHLLGDALKLNRILVNLLENAVKFSEKNGEISIKIIETEKEEECTVYFEISDNGMGIKKENLECLFDLFCKEEDSVSCKYGGSGLGLAISKNLIERMGGTLHVTSIYKEKTIFAFELSFSKSVHIEEENNKIVEKTTEIMSFQEYTLLLVEDNDMNLEIARTLLETAGFRVEYAMNGREAVEMFQASELYRYDGIIMDIQMPEMDGLEATRQIRRLVREDSKTVPIIAMTACVFDEDMREVMECGMNAYVAKPMDINKLYRLLENLLHLNK